MRRATRSTLKKGAAVGFYPTSSVDLCSHVTVLQSSKLADTPRSHCLFVLNRVGPQGEFWRLPPAPARALSSKVCRLIYRSLSGMPKGNQAAIQCVFRSQARIADERIPRRSIQNSERLARTAEAVGRTCLAAGLEHCSVLSVVADVERAMAPVLCFLAAR